MCICKYICMKSRFLLIRQYLLLVAVNVTSKCKRALNKLCLRIAFLFQVLNYKTGIILAF